MTQPRNHKKKSIEYHFVDINDPNRYKKLKVARACDFCRKRKSKCDIGIPGSGTCSNCIKSKNECVFSPVSATSSSNKAIISRQQKKMLSNSAYSSSSTNSSSTPTHTARTSASLSPTTTYRIQNSIFSMNSRGLCGYENSTSPVYKHMLFDSSIIDPPQCSPQMENDLLEIYFDLVHPFYPVLNRYFIMQSHPTIPNAMKFAIMAIAMHFTHHQDAKVLATTMYHHATLQLDHTPTLLNVQTLLLLYKFQEMTSPVGLSHSTVTLNYLKEIQDMLVQLQDIECDHVTEEFLCRARWIVYIIVAFSSPSDNMHCNHHPGRFPALTEREQYDKSELSIVCHLSHWIHVSLLFSQTVSNIARRGSLFTCATDDPELDAVAASLQVWKSALPNHIKMALSADPAAASGGGSFIAYLGMLCDMLELLLGLHSTDIQGIADKATRLSYRAHRFTVGDSGFLQRATIQGSRLVCYALTLATQSYSFYLDQRPPFDNDDNGDEEKIKKYHSVCSLAFQIMDEVPLSSQLYITIQSLRNQSKAKEQLTFLEKQQQHEFVSKGANYSTTSNFIEERSQDDSQQYFFHQEHHHYHHQHQEHHHQQQQENHVPQEDRQWQYYNQQHQSDGFDYHHIMTPDFEQELLTPDLEALPMTAESYFDHVPARHHPVYVNRSDTCIAFASQPSFVSLNIGIYKSCKNHVLL